MTMDAPRPNPKDQVLEPNAEKRELLKKSLQAAAAVWANSLIASEAAVRMHFVSSTSLVIPPDEFSFQPNATNHVGITHNPYELLAPLRSTPPNGHALDETKAALAIPKDDEIAQEVSRQLIYEGIREAWRKAAIVQRALKQQNLEVSRRSIHAYGPTILSEQGISCSERDKSTLYDVLFLNSKGVKRDELLSALHAHFTTPPQQTEASVPPRQRNPQLPRGKKK